MVSCVRSADSKERPRPDAVPSADAYSRFLNNLMDLETEIDEMFDIMVKRLTALLPDCGEILAVDGKAIPSHATGQNNIEGKPADGRRDSDADLREKGLSWKKTEWKCMGKSGELVWI